MPWRRLRPGRRMLVDAGELQAVVFAVKNPQYVKVFDIAPGHEGGALSEDPRPVAIVTAVPAVHRSSTEGRFLGWSSSWPRGG